MHWTKLVEAGLATAIPLGLFSIAIALFYVLGQMCVWLYG